MMMMIIIIIISIIISKSVPLHAMEVFGGEEV
jgi:hypothetical protein